MEQHEKETYKTEYFFGNIKQYFLSFRNSKKREKHKINQMCNQSQLLAPFGRARKSTSNILTLLDVRIKKNNKVGSH